MRRWLIFLALLALPFILYAQEEKGVTPVGATARVAPTVAPRPAPNGTTRAVVIGISNYQDDAIPDLQFADRDAEAFAAWLRSPAGGNVAEENIQVLLNEKATQAGVAMALTALMHLAKEGDHAIIYFSGHGDVESKLFDQPGFLLCWDAPATVYYAGGTLQLGMLQQIVTTLSLQNKARVLMITDACHAGRLAGSEIGGPQITTTNLAKRFASEVKVLSCQPGEFSLEGTQWDGGRGCFSYHLTDGLYGLADRNGDNLITLFELATYLGEHVPEETAPHRQFPFTVGDMNTQLAQVDAITLARVKAGKAGQALALERIEPRGMDSWVLANADSSILELYEAFNAALGKGCLLPTDSTAGKSADDYYRKLILEPALQPLQGLMTRNFAAALLDESQQVTNKVLKTDPQVVSDVWLRPFVFDHIPGYLARAIELLGEQHFMYDQLRVKKLYFEGLVAQTKDSSGVVNNSNLHIVSDKMEEALKIDSNAAFVYSYLAFFYIWTIRDSAKSVQYANRAVALVPSSVFVHYIAGFCYGTFGWKGQDSVLVSNAEKHLLKAQELDSTYLPVYQSLSWYYWLVNPDPERYEYYRNKLINAVQTQLEENPASVPYFNLLLLGIELWKAGRNVEAAAVLEKCEKLTHYKYITVYQFLGPVYGNLGQYENALEAAKKQIELSPFNPEGYNQLVEYASRLRRPGEIVKYLEASLLLPEIRAWGSYSVGLKVSLGEAYQEMGRKEEAQMQFQKVLELLPNPKTPLEINYLGRAYLGIGDLDGMKNAIEDGLKKFPGNPEALYQAGCLYSLAKDEKKALEYLRMAIKTGFNVFGFVARDKDWDNIRNSEGFKSLLKKYFPEEFKD